MSGAAPIIGLATQGLGLFAGGGGSQTVYQPDPRAKYEADMAMFARAEENAKLAEEVLRGQVQTQEGFAKYQYDMQTQLIDQETQAALNNLESQYNMGVFQQSMARLSNEADRYTNLVNIQRQREQANQELYQTMSRLGIARDEVDLQDRRLTTDRAGSDAAFRYSQDQTRVAKDQLALQAEQDKFQAGQARKRLTLQEAGLVDARTNINYQEQGLDLAQIQSDAAFSQELQALAAQSSQGNVQAQLAKANAEQTRKEALRQLSLNITGNEAEAQQFYNQMVSSGFSDDSANIAAVQAELVDSKQNRSARTTLMERYGMQLAQSDLINEMMQGDVARAGRSAQQNKSLSDAGIRQQRGGLDIARSGVNQQQQELGLSREDINYQLANAQANRELQAQQLAAQEQYDILSKSLLPNAQFDLAAAGLQNQRAGINLDEQNAKFGYGQNMTGIDAAANQFNVNQGIQEAGLDMAQESLLPTFTASQNQMLSQRTMNDASNFANYQQQLGAAQLAESAGLNQIAAQQHGILSGLGGYQNPAPPPSGGGGGMNWGGIGDFGQSLMAVLGGMGGGGGGGGFEPQLMPAYSPPPSWSSGYKSAPVNNTAMYSLPAPRMGYKQAQLAPIPQWGSSNVPYTPAPRMPRKDVQYGQDQRR